MHSKSILIGITCILLLIVGDPCRRPMTSCVFGEMSVMMFTPGFGLMFWSCLPCDKSVCGVLCFIWLKVRFLLKKRERFCQILGLTHFWRTFNKLLIIQQSFHSPLLLWKSFGKQCAAFCQSHCAPNGLWGDCVFCQRECLSTFNNWFHSHW